MPLEMTLADFPSCGPLGIIDINYFDFILTTHHSELSVRQ
jgi:hypothetical protein